MNRIALLAPMLLLVADGHSLASQGVASYDVLTRDPEIYAEGYLLSRLNERSINPDVRLDILQHELSLLRKRSSANEHSYSGEPKASTPLRLLQNRSLTDLEIERVIVSEATRAGVSPNYFIKLARRESSMNPFARSKSSSAAGLYQFTDNTWLCALKDYGPSLGIKGTEKIYKNKLGACEISIEDEHRYYLKLREDVRLSSRIVINFSINNARVYVSEFGSIPSDKDLYIIHFFGLKKATVFFRLLRKSPYSYAHFVTTKGAKANTTIFYKMGNQAKTIFEVYRDFDFDG